MMETAILMFGVALGFSVFMLWEQLTLKKRTEAWLLKQREALEEGRKNE